MGLDPIGARNRSVLLGFLSTAPMTPMGGLILIYVCGDGCVPGTSGCMFNTLLILSPVSLSRVIGVIGFRVENPSRTEPFRAPMGSSLIGGGHRPHRGSWTTVGNLIVDRLDVLLGGHLRFVVYLAEAPVQPLRQAPRRASAAMDGLSDPKWQRRLVRPAAHAQPARQTSQLANEGAALLVAHVWSEWGRARSPERG